MISLSTGNVPQKYMVNGSSAGVSYFAFFLELLATGLPARFNDVSCSSSVHSPSNKYSRMFAASANLVSSLFTLIIILLFTRPALYAVDRPFFAEDVPLYQPIWPVPLFVVLKVTHRAWSSRWGCLTTHSPFGNSTPRSVSPVSGQRFHPVEVFPYAAYAPEVRSRKMSPSEPTSRFSAGGPRPENWK